MKNFLYSMLFLVVYSSFCYASLPSLSDQRIVDKKNEKQSSSHSVEKENDESPQINNEFFKEYNDSLMNKNSSKKELQDNKFEVTDLMDSLPELPPETYQGSSDGNQQKGESEDKLFEKIKKDHEKLKQNDESNYLPRDSISTKKGGDNNNSSEDKTQLYQNSDDMQTSSRFERRKSLKESSRNKNSEKNTKIHKKSVVNNKKHPTIKDTDKPLNSDIKTTEETINDTNIIKNTDNDKLKLNQHHDNQKSENSFNDFNTSSQKDKSNGIITKNKKNLPSTNAEKTDKKDRNNLKDSNISLQQKKLDKDDIKNRQKLSNSNQMETNKEISTSDNVIKKKLPVQSSNKSSGLSSQGKDINELKMTDGILKRFKKEKPSHPPELPVTHNEKINNKSKAVIASQQEKKKNEVVKQQHDDVVDDHQQWKDLTKPVLQHKWPFSREVISSIDKVHYDEMNDHLPNIVMIKDYYKQMFYCVVENNIEGLRALIAKLNNINVDINSVLENLRTTQGDNLLIYAAKQNKVDVVRFLLSIGAFPNVSNYNNETPLSIAISNRRTDIINAITEMQDYYYKRINYNEQSELSSWTMMRKVTTSYNDNVKKSYANFDKNNNAMGNNQIGESSKLKGLLPEQSDDNHNPCVN